MAKTSTQRLGIFLALALVMAVTRIHLSLFNHDVRDASWAVFFLAGFWLRGQARWAFPLLMAEAVLIDFIVISNTGQSFWSHYCVSAAYWFLVPSYGALWLGGNWLARHDLGLRLPTLGLAAVALLVSASLCYLISNGSFYWLSASVPAPRSFANWFVNLGDWYVPFLGTTAIYVGVGAVLHVLAVQLARASRHAGQTNLPR
ncbi:hypothetical protein ASG87_09385 [Frateuria sp. Soil773]|uniref:hypothetical protein n=1 Tax=Frateuria sp. Soil773 TaxID=1736407 RepID=UPI0006FE41C5|nr:hypothetical protein [Frateuria sp. Soil773]KRE88770.1 hypothetical protein ASG87_09385 [Frateuria sp. Soil773]